MGTCCGKKKSKRKQNILLNPEELSDNKGKSSKGKKKRKSK